MFYVDNCEIRLACFVYVDDGEYLLSSRYPYDEWTALSNNIPHYDEVLKKIESLESEITEYIGGIELCEILERVKDIKSGYMCDNLLDPLEHFFCLECGKSIKLAIHLEVCDR